MKYFAWRNYVTITESAFSISVSVFFFLLYLHGTFLHRIAILDLFPPLHADPLHRNSLLGQTNSSFKIGIINMEKSFCQIPIYTTHCLFLKYFSIEIFCQKLRRNSRSSLLWRVVTPSILRTGNIRICTTFFVPTNQFYNLFLFLLPKRGHTGQISNIGCFESYWTCFSYHFSPNGK